MFRPQSFQCLEAATDASGKVTGWKHCVVGDGAVPVDHPGIENPVLRRAEPMDRAARRLARHSSSSTGGPSAHVFNTFAIESLVDQMAADGRASSVEFRFERMGATPKARKVVRGEWRRCATTRRSGRTAAPLGISITERSNSLGAGAVEISVDRTHRESRVHKVWAAIDGGLIVTRPAPAKANVESAIIYGLSSVLHGHRHPLRTGLVEQSNFHDYSLMRMSDTPEEIHVQFVDVDTRPTGLGEIGDPFIAGAISDAFSD